MANGQIPNQMPMEGPPQIPAGPPPMGLMGGMQGAPVDQFAPPPDLAAGAAPDMRGVIIQRLEEIEMEKGQLIAALQQIEGGGMGGGMQGGPPVGNPMGGGLLQPTV